MQEHVRGETFGFGQPDVLAVVNDGDSASSQPSLVLGIFAEPWYSETASLGSHETIALGDLDIFLGHLEEKDTDSIIFSFRPDLGKSLRKPSMILSF